MIVFQTSLSFENMYIFTLVKKHCIRNCSLIPNELPLPQPWFMKGTYVSFSSITTSPKRNGLLGYHQKTQPKSFIAWATERNAERCAPDARDPLD
mmetsp:Transcript_6137/g.7595  ORF Transcript_6137/g.7595 Transcript_6137/m.7595 type:complete len:95 (+) Transcript_6137:800-1084(+)